MSEPPAVAAAVEVVVVAADAEGLTWRSSEAEEGVDLAIKAEEGAAGASWPRWRPSEPWGRRRSRTAEARLRYKATIEVAEWYKAAAAVVAAAAVAAVAAVEAAAAVAVLVCGPGRRIERSHTAASEMKCFRLRQRLRRPLRRPHKAVGHRVHQPPLSCTSSAPLTDVA